MRKITFFTLVFLSWAGMAIAQVVSFPEKDAIWREEHITIAGPFSRHYGLCGDTLINGKIYSRLVEYELGDTGQVSGKTYRAAIRVEGPKVWTLPEGFNVEILLYDFSLQAGQQIELFDLVSVSPVTRTVDSVKVENIAAADRRVIYFKPDIPGETGEFWIEGFGSNYGVLWRAYLPAADLGFALLCFQHDDVYLNLTLIECFLPPMPNCGTINSVETLKSEMPPKLTVSPNPAGSDALFSISPARGLEGYNLKIYTANGKLLKTVEQVSAETRLSSLELLNPGFYIAVLETKKRGQVVAHCSFVMGQ